MYKSGIEANFYQNRTRGRREGNQLIVKECWYLPGRNRPMYVRHAVWIWMFWLVVCAIQRDDEMWRVGVELNDGAKLIFSFREKEWNFLEVSRMNLSKRVANVGYWWMWLCDRKTMVNKGLNEVFNVRCQNKRSQIWNVIQTTYVEYKMTISR